MLVFAAAISITCFLQDSSARKSGIDRRPFGTSIYSTPSIVSTVSNLWARPVKLEMVFFIEPASTPASLEGNNRSQEVLDIMQSFKFHVIIEYISSAFPAPA